MTTLLYNPRAILTCAAGGKLYAKGDDFGTCNILTGSSVVIEDDIIKSIIPTPEKTENFENVIDLTGKTLLPGFIECHTHLVFAGNRINEFKMKLEGATYEEIAASGGGINTTVLAVRNATEEELLDSAIKRVEKFIRQGVTTIEIKSGYGLSYDDELKLLRVIKKLGEVCGTDVAATFLGAHTFPPEYKSDHGAYIKLITQKMLPAIADENLAEFCDGFCESSAFSPAEISQVFDTAASLGLKLKLHTDQFNRIGGLATAIKYGAVSADHLEVAEDEECDIISASETVAVLLPGVSYFLNYDYAPAVKLKNKGAVVALATDFNPGSSHITNIPFLMSLASRKMGLTFENIFNAWTINAAYALRRSDKTGSVEPGKKADFAVLDTDDYREVFYNVAENLNVMTIKNGRIIYKA